MYTNPLSQIWRMMQMYCQLPFTNIRIPLHEHRYITYNLLEIRKLNTINNANANKVSNWKWTNQTFEKPLYVCGFGWQSLNYCITSFFFLDLGWIVMYAVCHDNQPKTSKKLLISQPTVTLALELNIKLITIPTINLLWFSSSVCR